MYSLVEFRKHKVRMRASQFPVRAAGFFMASFQMRAFDSDKQLLMDQLLEQNQNGTISDSDKQQLRGLVEEAERLMAENARMLAAYAKEDREGNSGTPVPVTVWVKPSVPAN